MPAQTAFGAHAAAPLGGTEPEEDDVLADDDVPLGAGGGELAVELVDGDAVPWVAGAGGGGGDDGCGSSSPKLHARRASDSEHAARPRANQEFIHPPTRKEKQRRPRPTPARQQAECLADFA